MKNERNYQKKLSKWVQTSSKKSPKNQSKNAAEKTSEKRACVATGGGV
jgi:hypothetical protein